MKRGLWMVAAATVVITAGVSLIALPRGDEWTTSSAEALAEFEAAMEAQTKLYKQEAKAHLEKALELDPDFVIAKLQFQEYAWGDDKERGEQLMDEALAADLESLTPRERLMVERVTLLHEKRREEAETLVDEYLERYPNDPWVVYIKAMGAWSSRNNEAAERLFLRLLEIDPNWVISYNQLGYITMMEGRFAEAEEYFTSYRFIAPDQANPHDSLGELFILLGRYQEAVDSLERAVQIKPDFVPAYQHLILTHGLMGDRQAVQDVIARIEALPLVSESMLDEIRCEVLYVELSDDRAWQEIVERADSSCIEGMKAGTAVFFTHRAACLVGDWQLAAAMEAALTPEKSQSSSKSESMDVFAMHAEAVRLALTGRGDEAVALLHEVDHQMTYLSAGLGIFKLHNRLVLVEVLRALGREAEAHKLLGQVIAVNPPLAADFQEDGLQILGLTH